MSDVDYILEIGFDSSLPALQDEVDVALFTSRSSGSSSVTTGDWVTISAYFDSADDREELRRVLAQNDALDLTPVDRPREDWLARYQQSLQPLLIGERFVVAPSRELIPAGNRLAIVIPQEEAFGTGSHDTTSMCLEMLERVDCEGRLALDIGTGTGILALGLALAGSRKVVAFDNDVDTIGVLRKNLARNPGGAASIVSFYGGVGALRGSGFDVVVMNILAEVIVELLPAVAKVMARGASLIVSGIILERRAAVVAAASAVGLQVVAEKSSTEWWCGVLGGR